MRFERAVRIGDLAGLRATVMGLGLHGGGAASARFLASRGARVTVTDLKPEEDLRSSLADLEDLPLRLALGRHEREDFLDADVVIKNPGVPSDSPFLELSRARGIPIETDISLFLRFAGNPILAVTGTKGKSTTASAVHHVLKDQRPGSRLGGNITVSPLTFLEKLEAEAPVVLELSSWQLGDLRDTGLLAPKISLVTVLLPDHMNRYSGMEEYVEDKKVIFRDQGRSDAAIFNADDTLQRGFPEETRAKAYTFSSTRLPDGLEGAWLEGGGGRCRIHGGESLILREPLRLLGEHNRMNLLAAGLALALYDVPPEAVAEGLSDFGGVEHRLELFTEIGGIRFYNDSTATIPHATVRAVRSVPPPVHLIAGGTDKNIDFSPLREILRVPRSIALLEGSGTEKMFALFDEMSVSYGGPFDRLEAAVDFALEHASAGSSVLFSPGCTSFGMFQNEFERGRRFKEAVLARVGGEPRS